MSNHFMGVVDATWRIWGVGDNLDGILAITDTCCGFMGCSLGKLFLFLK